jgi:hypothetical protein
MSELESVGEQCDCDLILNFTSTLLDCVIDAMHQIIERMTEIK